MTHVERHNAIASAITALVGKDDREAFTTWILRSQDESRQYIDAADAIYGILMRWESHCYQQVYIDEGL